MSLLRPIEVGAAETASLLGRTSPLVKLGVAFAWLLGLATTLDARPGLFLGIAAVLAIPLLGSVPSERIVRFLGPLALAAAGIGLANLLWAASNTDPAAAEVLGLGPVRITEPAVSAAAGLVARLLAIAAVGAAFSLTTSATRLADALVQQVRLSPRFAYGALAAYEAVPGLAADFSTIRDARRLRGLPAWYPRIVVTLLVRAIRRADQLAVAMDARGFGSGPRSSYRPIAWGWPDLAVGGTGLVLLVVALLGSR